ncbi:hypothetical protein G6321_00018970 [Bradyrhizobium barranii subsp. barranii]|uniref:Uncharacterized protein n=1 Tax=Bradyrhizobium barranii subsp. barranii TaxID=2823807 RepID=A0A7Z0QLE0_9BRAD|nr:hypothetical protein [Bradyrhizobium barranii]UGX97097.1 hypothetical protein G6321_00018970 [Bradyrhizobium barranii subsp. barranii]
MSNKIDFIKYLTSTLAAASRNLQSAQTPDLAAAGRLDRIVNTAENISSGYWARIAPVYEGAWPIAPDLFRSVRQSNANIMAGQNVANFDAYIALLVAALGTTPSKFYPSSD